MSLNLVERQKLDYTDFRNGGYSFHWAILDRHCKSSGVAVRPFPVLKPHSVKQKFGPARYKSQIRAPPTD